MAKSMFDDLKKYLGSTARDPAYVYGNILPYRVKTDAQGNPIKGTGDWGLGYSNVAKGMFDTLMAPRQAMQGQSFTPEQAMNFAMNVTTPGVATARYVPGMFNMPIVYHGTPHRFAPTPDNPLGEFDASKIGTGEGAQSYGHGLYLAESPDVASGYKSRLSASTYIKDSVPIKSGMIWQKAADAASEIGKLHPDNAGQISSQIMDWVDSGKKPETFLKFNKVSPQLQSAYEAAVKEYAGAMKNKGSLYTVDLPDEMIDKMLDWDKPLSEQPEAVRKALLENSEIYSEVQRLNAQRETLNAQNPQRLSHPVIGKLAKRETTAESLKGQSIYELLTKGRSRKEASEYLKSLGIPGIKYLDQGSRKKGKGTRNFVVFPGDEKKAKIINRE